MTRTFLDLVEQFEWSMKAADIAYGHGTDNAFDEAAWLVAHATGVNLSNADDLPWDAVVDDVAAEAATALLKRRLDTRKPLAYLINEAWFAGERYYVDERVIVPRSHFGEWIVERFEPWVDVDRVGSALDLCTGSGCIAIAMALNFPDATITGSDISADALEVAARNAAEHGVDGRVRLVRGDLFDAVPGERFDLVVCNPPYVSDDLMRDLPDEYRREPEIAFRGGDTGLDVIARLLRGAASYLNPGGALLVEAGSANTAVEKAYPDVPFTWLASAAGEPVIFLLTREELDRYFPRS